MRKTRIPAPPTSMEISKTLQEEILTVQNKLKNAIRDHQICVGKLKDDPHNTIILGRIQDIHLHIVSLDRCQKQVLQRLRKEVEAFKAQNANGPKVSLASLLGLDNNNRHITNNNDKRNNKVVGNTNNLDVKISKDDYEDTVRNSDVPSPSQENSPSKDRSSSVETISGEDDVIEVSMDENSNETQEELDKKDCKNEVNEKITFLSNLSLITNARYSELQNKRVERKRRSTANPQFVYSCFEAPMKRKRCTYLQSGGSAPQTRQTTARMNGPSPPPVSKTALPKSTSPPSRTTIGKSLIPLQKSMTRPNILRNASENKVYTGKGKVENGSNSIPLPIVGTKTIQSTGSRTVHIPGLPSSLTIERIENDSIVCIRCRNPGTLTVCENCSANYHVSCHSVSPAPPRICPKCAFVEDDEEEEEEEDAEIQEAEEDDEEEEVNGRESCNKEEELATTSYASGAIRKAGEDTEIHKASCGLYKADATTKRHVLASALGIGQLPSSTFLIPISPSNVTSPNHEYSTISAIATRTDVEQSENNNGNGNSSGRSYSSIVLNHLPQSNISYMQSEPQLPYTYQLPISSVQPEKHQSYLIVKKISEPIGRSAQLAIGTQSEGQSLSTFFDSQLPTTSRYESRVHSEVTLAQSSVYLEKHFSESVGRGRSKKTNRAVPALNRIVDSEEFSVTTSDRPMERSTYNGKKPRTRQSRIKLGIDHLRTTTRDTEFLLPAYDGSTISTEQFPMSNSANTKETFLGGRSKNRTRSSGLLHSLFSGYDSSCVVADDTTLVLSRTTCNTNDKDRTDLYQQSYRKTDRFESVEHPNEHQRGTIAKFFEHVKLEEAHISAPPRAKLACKSTNIEIEEVNRSQQDEDEEDSHRSSDNEFLDEETTQNFNERVERVGPSGEDNSRIKTPEYVGLVDAEPCSGITTKGNVDGNISSIEAILEVNDKISSSKKDLPETSSSQSQTAQVNQIKSDDEVSVPDDKADVERQDLHGGRSSSSTPHSDVPNKPPIIEEKRSSKEKLDEDLGISSVSLENMRVLEQFESAMLEADCSKTATC
ncbi:uncharacterized protein LOC124948370 isoform X1 [Vespa velutina]|uniref:uncharacterized protein LOC124948370 isoform X1 n=1 Tax=Vespa velutina TaxID=202808 RepID=UPI001FB31275|nr:uncharacterized protein LOC124948370 isoform X1 [Vespa velutina]